MEKFEAIKNSLLETVNNKKNKIAKLKDELNKAKSEGKENRVENLTIRINDALDGLIIAQSKINSMRLPIQEDVEERTNIIYYYAKKVEEVIPDNIPLVFHGNRYIGMVEEIMRSGGLFTPEDRNVDYKSFATQIDVTWKGNIQTSLEFAEPGLDFIFPYGAIFVFYPKEEEYDNVLRTGKGTEVFNGVESINFKEDNRLFAIITTNENIDRLRKCAREVQIDENIIMTHEMFLDYCKEKYHSHTR